jgi:hypothetical protein
MLSGVVALRVEKRESRGSMSFCEIRFDRHCFFVRLSNEKPIGKVFENKTARQAVALEFAGLELAPLFICQIRYDETIKYVNRELVTRSPAAPMAIKPVFEPSPFLLDDCEIETASSYSNVQKLLVFPNRVHTVRRQR